MSYSYGAVSFRTQPKMIHSTVAARTPLFSEKCLALRFLLSSVVVSGFVSQHTAEKAKTCNAWYFVCVYVFLMDPKLLALNSFIFGQFLFDSRKGKMLVTDREH